MLKLTKPFSNNKTNQLKILEGTEWMKKINGKRGNEMWKLCYVKEIIKLVTKLNFWKFSRLIILKLEIIQ
jgi:hypothetical protein